MVLVKKVMDMPVDVALMVAIGIADMLIDMVFIAELIGIGIDIDMDMSAVFVLRAEPDEVLNVKM
jgi:hypothetical protein